MLLKILYTDQIKLKRSPMWLAFLFMPIIPALLGTLNYSANIEILQNEWYSLWTQHTLFTCYFFLPIMIGVYCAYLMRLEHGSQNWNKMLSMPAARYQIFLSKLIIASTLVFLSEIWIAVLFILSGKIAGLTAPVPQELPMWILCGTLGGMVTVSIQLLLSLIIKSFALPVGIALAGGLSGLVALVKGFGHIWPYSLMAYGMKANAPQEISSNGYSGFVLTCILYIIAFTAFGSLWLSKKDVS